MNYNFCPTDIQMVLKSPGQLKLFTDPDFIIGIIIKNNYRQKVWWYNGYPVDWVEVVLSICPNTSYKVYLLEHAYVHDTDKVSEWFVSYVFDIFKEINLRYFYNLVLFIHLMTFTEQQLLYIYTNCNQEDTYVINTLKEKSDKLRMIIELTDE